MQEKHIENIENINENWDCVVDGLNSGASPRGSNGNIGGYIYIYILFFFPFF